MQSQNITSINNAQFLSCATHSFDINFARLYGVDEAILMKHLIYWIEFNKRKGVNFLEGKTWMYQTQEDMCDHHPYWTRKQVMRILKSLVKNGLIVVKNFNKSKQDRTQWYALASEEMFTYTQIGTNGTQTKSTEKESKKSFESPNQDPLSLNRETPIPKQANVYICEDPKTDTKQKTAAAVATDSIGKLLTDTKAARPFAAASSDEEGERTQPPDKKVVVAAPTSPLTITKQKNSSILDTLDISGNEKEWLLKHYSLPAIELSIDWVTHPTTQVKKSVISAIKWFLSLPVEERPKTPSQNIEEAEKNKQLAEHLEKTLESEHYQIVALNRLLLIEPKIGGAGAIEIPYDKENFEKTAKDAIGKRGFRIIKP